MLDREPPEYIWRSLIYENIDPNLSIFSQMRKTKSIRVFRNPNRESKLTSKMRYIQYALYQKQGIASN